MASYQKPGNTHELRQKIFTSIDKLSDRATFSQASSELNYLAKTLPLDFLPTFLSCILSIDSSSKSPVRVHCITLISLLNQTHKTSLSPHLSKITAFLLRRLRDSDSSVRNACVSTVSALSPLNYPFLLDPILGSISIEQDLNAQMGCCLCLSAALDYGVLEEREEGDLKKRVLPKVMKLLKGDGFKAKGALLGVIESVVGVNDGAVINNNSNNGGSLVGNVVGVAVEMLSSDDWMARKSAAQVLLKMAVVVDDDSAAEFKRFVVNSLDSKRFDKVKVTREIMNRALEAWREVPGGPEEEIALTRSNSSISKESGTTGGASPPIPRRFSYAGTETLKPKKSMAKCRSSLSEGPVATVSPSMSPSTRDSFGLETPQRRRTLSKSRSSLSDDSTITDSSSVSISSHDVVSEAAQSKRRTSKGRSSLPLKANDKKSSVYQNAEPKKSSDWKGVPPAPSEEVVSEMSSNFVKKASEERVPKFSAFKSGSSVVPFAEEDVPRGLDFDGGGNEEVSESIQSNADSEDLSLIRKQLLQIERQQSDMVVLIQRFMGNSQSGIDSLETRVSGLERALDEISHDLAVQSGRIANNDSAGSTCCPSTEFLSPKFWRRTEGRSSSISKSSYSGSMPNRDACVEAPQMDGYKHHEQNEGLCRESWGSVKGIGQTGQRGRNCSPRSFDSASTAACITSVVQGA